jgi:hypothetical protein
MQLLICLVTTAWCPCSRHALRANNEGSEIVAVATSCSLELVPRASGGAGEQSLRRSTVVVPHTVAVRTLWAWW